LLAECNITINTDNMDVTKLTNMRRARLDRAGIGQRLEKVKCSLKIKFIFNEHFTFSSL